MLNAAEQFAIQLGRASKKARALLRYANPADRDDMIAATMLSCWEHRGAFDPSEISLEDWFAAHLRTVRKEFRKRRHHVSSEQLGELIASEDTEREAQEKQAAEIAASTLTPEELKIYSMLRAGSSYKEVHEAIGKTTLITKSLLRKLRRIGEALPNTRAWEFGRTKAPSSDDDKPAAPIDHEIERMLRRPVTERADCPVCWLCSYFYGFTPKNYKPKPIADGYVCAAVRCTEAAKIEIGNRV